MKVVALISGGKDSCYNMMKCVQNGHEIICLANLRPPDLSIEEMDSFTFQTVGHTVLEAYSECMGIPLIRGSLHGGNVHSTLQYTPTAGDEVEDLYNLLAEVKRQHPDVQAVSSGAILSDYQRLRVENVCSRLGLVSLAYLWRSDQSQLLEEMIESGLVAVLIKTAAMGLNPKKHLGKTLGSLRPLLEQLSTDYGCSVCGEGGEYESITLDCPLFKKRILLTETKIELASEDPFAPVGFLRINGFQLEDKDAGSFWESPSSPAESAAAAASSPPSSIYVMPSVTKSESEYSEWISSLRARYEASGVQISTHTNAAGPLLRITSSFSSIISHQMSPSDEIQFLLLSLSDALQRIHPASTLSQLCLNIVLHVSSMSCFSEVNSAYSLFFSSSSSVPSRVFIETPAVSSSVSSPSHHCRFLECYSYTPIAFSLPRTIMHVQSVSNWAPACIGPYSQAVRVAGGLVFVAGQIALVPASMQMISIPTVSVELKRVLQSTQSILQAMNSSLSSLCKCTLFVSFSASASASSISNIYSIWKQEIKSLFDDGVQILDPLIIVVPCLPRNALVEVQVIGMSSDWENDIRTHLIHGPRLISDDAPKSASRSDDYADSSDEEGEEEGGVSRASKQMAAKTAMKSFCTQVPSFEASAVVVHAASPRMIHLSTRVDSSASVMDAMNTLEDAGREWSIALANELRFKLGRRTEWLQGAILARRAWIPASLPGSTEIASLLEEKGFSLVSCADVMNGPRKDSEEPSVTLEMEVLRPIPRPPRTQ